MHVNVSICRNNTIFVAQRSENVSVSVASTPLSLTKSQLRGNYSGVSSTPSESAVNVGTRATLFNLTLQLISSLPAKDCLTKTLFRTLKPINFVPYREFKATLSPTLMIYVVLRNTEVLTDVPVQIENEL